MAKTEVPQRPTDPVGAWMWDMTYGPASQGTPFAMMGQKIDGLKDEFKSMLTVSKSMDKVNETIQESNNIMGQMNTTMKQVNETLKLLAERFK